MVSRASLRDRWDAAARLITENRDVLDARPANGEPPHALVSRDWASFLLALDDDRLTELEIRGHSADWPTEAPPSLVALVERARDVCALPPLSRHSGPARPARRLETPRKREQVDAFASLVLPLAARASRVVDVGSGHGHLTRAIADRIALPVVGLERDLELAGRARSLSSPRSGLSTASPSFAVTDVLQDGLELSPGDCVIGLHACGELGDAIVESVARCSGGSLALVGCCLQKRRGPSRPPLCKALEGGGALELPTRLLGLSNLAAGDLGVEATRAENLAARERRLALHRLLSETGGPLRFGAEIDGLNRRAAQRDLRWLVARAFALRSWAPPSLQAIEAAALWAHTHHAHARRLAVPRSMLARVLEVFVLLDRALYLEEHGLEVLVGTLFPTTVSARNLAIVAGPILHDPVSGQIGTGATKQER